MQIPGLRTRTWGSGVRNILNPAPLLKCLRISLLLGCIDALYAYPQSSLVQLDPKVPNSGPFTTLYKEVLEVNLTFTVTDHRGHFVNGLGKDDFTIRDNGREPERITHFESRSELPLRIAVVIDTSASEGCCLDAEKRAAKEFLKHILRPDSDLAVIIGFDSSARVVQSPSNDYHLLARSIGHLRTNGETAIYDAVSFASAELLKIDIGRPVRRVIVVVSDGEDNRSQIDLVQAQQNAQHSESSLYVISTNPGVGRLTERDEDMRQLSDTTGGIFIRAGNGADMWEAFSKIIQGLRNQYVIGYKPAGTVPDGSFHSLVVMGPQKVRVHYRLGYFARPLAQ